MPEESGYSQIKKVTEAASTVCAQCAACHLGCDQWAALELTLAAYTHEPLCHLRGPVLWLPARYSSRSRAPGDKSTSSVAQALRRRIIAAETKRSRRVTCSVLVEPVWQQSAVMRPLHLPDVPLRRVYAVSNLPVLDARHYAAILHNEVREHLPCRIRLESSALDDSQTRASTLPSRCSGSKSSTRENCSAHRCPTTH